MTKKKAVSGKTSTKSGKISTKKEVKPKLTKKITKDFTIEELEAALFEADEDFNRSVLRLMLLGETLRSIKEDNQVKGNKIEIGILETRLTKEVDGWFKEFGYKRDGSYLKKEFKGVPIEIRIIKREYPFFKHLDKVFYKAFDTFDIPNPWRAYFKVRGLIR